MLSEIRFGISLMKALDKLDDGDSRGAAEVMKEHVLSTFTRDPVERAVEDRADAVLGNIADLFGF